RKAAQQIAIAALALAVWGAIGQPRSSVWVGCYLAVWLALQWSPLRARLFELRSSQLLILALAAGLPALVFAYRTRARIAEEDGLVGLVEHARDRWRLSATPAIAPPLISADRPQTFFVYGPGSAKLQAQFGRQARELSGEALGRGLFRLDYDPR